jgi:hypothetical protein
MFLKCACGTVLDDIAAPNSVEHLLLSYAAMEKLEGLVDEEVEAHGVVNEWPEHWENAGAVDVWRCHHCGRLHFNAKGAREDRVVYAIEQQSTATS